MRVVALCVVAALLLAACGSSAKKTQIETSSTLAPTSTTDLPTTSRSAPSPAVTTPHTAATAPAPTTTRSNYCDITATWTPRDSSGRTTLHLQVTSDEPNGTIATDIHETKSAWKSGDQGMTDANGSYSKDLIFNSATAAESPMAGDAMIYVRILTPQYAQCSLLSHAPTG